MIDINNTLPNDNKEIDIGNQLITLVNEDSKEAETVKLKDIKDPQLKNLIDGYSVNFFNKIIPNFESIIRNGTKFDFREFPIIKFKFIYKSTLITNEPTIVDN